MSLCNAIEQGAFSKLQELTIQTCKVGDDGMIKIVDAMALSPHRFKLLLILDLEQNYFGHEGESALFTALQRGACPVLEKLSLAPNKMKDEGLMSFAAALAKGMPCSDSMKKLNLRSCEIRWRGVKALFKVMTEKGALANIKELDLSDSRSIGDEAILEILSAFEKGIARKLRRFCMRAMNISDVGAKSFGKALVGKACLQRFNTLGSIFHLGILKVS